MHQTGWFVEKQVTPKRSSTGYCIHHTVNPFVPLSIHASCFMLMAFILPQTDSYFLRNTVVLSLSLPPPTTIAATLSLFKCFPRHVRLPFQSSAPRNSFAGSHTHAGLSFQLLSPLLGHTDTRSIATPRVTCCHSRPFPLETVLCLGTCSPLFPLSFFLLHCLFPHS